jgi:hypothetical protein
MLSVDAELVRKVIEGTSVESRSAYGELLKLHESAVRWLLRTLCRNLAQADDLAQDAFLQGWQRLFSLQHPAWVEFLQVLSHLGDLRVIVTDWLSSSSALDLASWGSSSVLIVAVLLGSSILGLLLDE